MDVFVRSDKGKERDGGTVKFPEAGSNPTWTVCTKPYGLPVAPILGQRE